MEGIGKVTVRELARKGAHVFLLARSKDKALAAIEDIKVSLDGKGKIDFMQLDLSSLNDVKSFTDAFKSLNLPIDMLILNAVRVFF